VEGGAARAAAASGGGSVLHLLVLLLLLPLRLRVGRGHECATSTAWKGL